MRLAGLSCLVVLTTLVAAAPRAHAECRCLSVAADVGASVELDVAKADSLYSRGDFAGALALYTRSFGSSKDSALLYAQAMCQWQLGATAQAQGLFDAYLPAG